MCPIYHISNLVYQISLCTLKKNPKNENKKRKSWRHWIRYTGLGKNAFLSILASSSCAYTTNIRKNSAKKSVCFILWWKTIVSRNLFSPFLTKIYSTHLFIYSGFVDRDKILDYGNNRERFVSKRRGFAFQNAVKQMDEYVSDSTVCAIEFLFSLMKKLISDQ